VIRWTYARFEDLTNTTDAHLITEGTSRSRVSARGETPVRVTRAPTEIKWTQARIEDLTNSTDAHLITEAGGSPRPPDHENTAAADRRSG
jgi:hypothetical protein